MRYLIQLLIPVLIFGAVLYALTRTRRRDPGAGDAADGEPGSDTGAFITILIVSAVVALGTGYALIVLWQ